MTEILKRKQNNFQIMIKLKPGSVDHYIKSAPEKAREKLIEMRAILKKLHPMQLKR